MVVFCYTVATQEVGKLIGKGAAVIGALRSQHNDVKIDVGSRTGAVRRVTVRGTKPANVTTAVQATLSCLLDSVVVAPYVVTVLVDGAQVGRIIGYGGNGIRALREAAGPGVTIDIDRPLDARTVNIRHITLTFTDSPVAMVERARTVVSRLTERLWKFKHSSTSDAAYPRRIQDGTVQTRLPLPPLLSLPTLPTVSNVIPHQLWMLPPSMTAAAAASVVVQQQSPPPPPQTTTTGHTSTATTTVHTLRIHQRVVGAILGRGGVVVQDIRKRSLAHVNIAAAPDAYGMRLVTVESTSPSAVATACGMLRDVLHRRSQQHNGGVTATA